MIKKLLQLKKLSVFIARLSKRQKIMLYCALSFVCLAALDRLVTNPILSKIESLNKEIITKESQVKQDLRILAQKDRVLAQIARYSSFLGSMGSQEEEIVSALKEIENLANKSSIYLVDLKPAGQKIFGASKGYMIALNCEAQMEQIAEFIYNIQSSNRLFVVEKIQISPKSKDSSVAKCSLSIAKVILP